jgi:hypothetical protein
MEQAVVQGFCSRLQEEVYDMTMCKKYDREIMSTRRNKLTIATKSDVVNDKPSELPKKKVKQHSTRKTRRAPRLSRAEEESKGEPVEESVDESKDEPVEEVAPSPEQSTYLEELRRKRDECRVQCELMSKEIVSLERDERNETLRDVVLDPDSTLIDLLAKRILDPSPEWRSRVNSLIYIPEGEPPSAPPPPTPLELQIIEQQAKLDAVVRQSEEAEARGEGTGPLQDTIREERTLLETLRESAPPKQKPVPKRTLTGGDYFEALFQLAFALGITPETSGRKVVFYNIVNYKTPSRWDNYLHEKKVKNSGGGEQGIEDFLFRVCNPDSAASDCATEGSSVEASNIPSYACAVKPKDSKEDQDTVKSEKKKEDQDAIYYGSVKRFRGEKSPAKHYDIPILQQQMSLVFPENPNKTLFVCVRDEATFRNKLGRTRMDFLKLIIRNNVFGYETLMGYFEIFRKAFLAKFESPTPELIAAEVNRLYPKSTVVKPILSLYFHQELVVKSVDTRIQETPVSTDPHFMCIGVLPRGGKSFIAGGIIDSQHKDKSKPFNVLFLTSAVNETRSQFKEELIEKFAEFADFDFIDAVNDTPNRSSKKNKFVFVSRQLSTLTEKEGEEVSILSATLTKKKVTVPYEDRVKSFLPSDSAMFDLCFFDEAHIGIRSDKVNEGFRNLFKNFNTTLIWLMT